MRPSAITSLAELCPALMREANLIGQKCLIGYCHARTQLPMNELMREAPFKTAYDHACAETIVAVLADLVVVAEGRLRAAAGGRAARVAAALCQMYRRSIAAEPALMSHVNLDAAVTVLERRLAAAQLSAPRGSAEIAEVSGRRLYDVLPIHERLRRPDRNSVIASVRFMLMARYQVLDRRMAVDQIVADMAPDATTAS